MISFGDRFIYSYACEFVCNLILKNVCSKKSIRKK